MIRTEKLGEVADVVAGVGFPKEMQGKEAGEIPVFKVGDISAAWLAGERVLRTSRNYLSADQARRLGKPVPAGSTVFAKIGEALRLNRRAILGQPSLIDNNVMGVVPRTDALGPLYLFYFMQTVDLGKLARATAVPSVRKSDVVDIGIPLPSLAEQERVVAEIEKQFSRLDEAVANLKRVKANLKRYKAAVLKAAVEGSLVTTEAELARSEGRTPATAGESIRRILEDRRQSWSGRGKYKEPAPVEFEGLPTLPDGWAWATVDQLAAPEPNAITDGPFGSNLKTEHYRDTGPRVIRLQNIGDGEFVDEEAHISAEHFERLRKHEVHAGDLVIATLGENPPRACVLPAHVGPAIVKADCIRFRPHTTLDARYLNAALNALPTRQRTKDRLHGVGRPRLSLGEIRSIPLPLPPVEEQGRIAAEIDRLLSVNEEVCADVDRRLAAADRLRRSILERAFRGTGVDQGTPLAPYAHDRADNASAGSSDETVPDTWGENLMRVVRKMGIREALEANSGWVSTGDLLAAAGLPPAAAPEEMEQFYLQLREVLRSGSPAIEVQRRDGVDYFRKV